MDTLEQTLNERVEELILSHTGQLPSTTGTRAAIAELATRSKGLELAVRQLALEVQNLSLSQRRIDDADAPLQRSTAGGVVSG